MKKQSIEVTQIKPEFEPITICLNSRSAARTFFGLVDKIDLNTSTIMITLSVEEKKMLIQFSNSLTNMDVTI